MMQRREIHPARRKYYMIRLIYQVSPNVHASVKHFLCSFCLLIRALKRGLQFLASWSNDQNGLCPPAAPPSSVVSAFCLSHRFFTGLRFCASQNWFAHPWLLKYPSGAVKVRNPWHRFAFPPCSLVYLRSIISSTFSAFNSLLGCRYQQKPLDEVLSAS